MRPRRYPAPVAPTAHRAMASGPGVDPPTVGGRCDPGPDRRLDPWTQTPGMTHQVQRAPGLALGERRRHRGWTRSSWSGSSCPFLAPIGTSVGTHRTRPLVLVHLIAHRPDGTRSTGGASARRWPTPPTTPRTPTARPPRWPRSWSPRCSGRADERGALPGHRRVGRRRRPGRSPAGLRRTRDGGGRCPPAGGRGVVRRSARRGRSHASSPVPSSAYPAPSISWPPTSTAARAGRVRPGEDQGGPGLGGPDRRGRPAPGGLGAPGPTRCQRLLRPTTPPTGWPSSTTWAWSASSSPSTATTSTVTAVWPPHWPRRSAWTRAWTPVARVVEAVGYRGVLGGVRQAGPPRRHRCRPRGHRLVRGEGRPVVDRRDVRVGLRPWGQSVRWPRCRAPSLPGDLAPPPSYLAGDLVGPVPVGLDPATGRLVLPVPTGPGLGPAPDPALLDRWSVDRDRAAGTAA